MGFMSKLTGGFDAPAHSVNLITQSGPAVQRETVAAATGGVNLVKKFEKAGISLSKSGLDGIRAEAVMILDHSGSMYEGYQGGMVQTLVDRALGFALQIDVDGKIPVIPFDSRLWPTVDVSLENYFGVVDREIFKPNHMGGTTLAPALEVVLQMAKETTSPIFLIIVTDDSPGDRDRVTALLKELKLYPVFVKVLSLIDAHYWNKMDDLVVRGRVDNIDAKQVLDPIGINDLPFADLMTDEWSSWIAEAKSAGILV